MTHVSKGAFISACGQFRYWLVRQWDDSLPCLVFVMLNPSTADANEDDATIRKCMGFARAKGYGGILVVNLYAYRATHPRVLKFNGWQTGPDNGKALSMALELARKQEGGEHRVICAWGANARGRPEAGAFIQAATIVGVPLYALKRSPDGTPHHPLMLPYTCNMEAMS